MEHPWMQLLESFEDPDARRTALKVLPFQVKELIFQRLCQEPRKQARQRYLLSIAAGDELLDLLQSADFTNVTGPALLSWGLKVPWRKLFNEMSSPIPACIYLIKQWLEYDQENDRDSIISGLYHYASEYNGQPAIITSLGPQAAGTLITIVMGTQGPRKSPQRGSPKLLSLNNVEAMDLSHTAREPSSTRSLTNLAADDRDPLQYSLSNHPGLHLSPAAPTNTRSYSSPLAKRGRHQPCPDYEVLDEPHEVSVSGKLVAPRKYPSAMALYLGQSHLVLSIIR